MKGMRHWSPPIPSEYAEELTAPPRKPTCPRGPRLSNSSSNCKPLSAFPQPGLPEPLKPPQLLHPLNPEAAQALCRTRGAHAGGQALHRAAPWREAHVGAYDVRGTFLGSLWQGDPPIWGSVFRVHDCHEPPCVFQAPELCRLWGFMVEGVGRGGCLLESALLLSPPCTAPGPYNCIRLPPPSCFTDPSSSKTGNTQSLMQGCNWRETQQSFRP